MGEEKTPPTAMAVLMQDTAILGQFAGAAVCGLLAVSLAASTVFKFLEQRELRAAVQGFYTQSQQPKTEGGRRRAQLLESFNALAAERPGDVGLHMMFGDLLRKADKPDQAAKVFELARDAAPERASPYVGLAVLALDRAESDAAQRVDHLEEARGHIDNIESRGLAFEAQVLRGAALLLEQRPAEAAKVYNQLKTDLGSMRRGSLPSREMVAAFTWNRGLAALLDDNPECIVILATALQYHRAWPDATEVLLTACRAMLDREVSVEEVRRRCELIEPILTRNISNPADRSQDNRYGLDREKVSLIYNAMGLALFEREDYEGARQYLVKAQQREAGNPTYNRNVAVVLRLQAQQEADERARDKALGEAGNYFKRAAAASDDKAFKHACLFNAGVLFTRIRRFGDAISNLNAARDLGVELGEVYRALGILYMMKASRREAIENFKQAIKAGHPESTELEIRIQALGG